MTEETHDRLDRLESLVERQQRVIEDQTETIDEYRETIETLEAGNDSGSLSVDRRSVLKAGGALGALGLGVGTASAAPTGQVGTVDRPIETVHADGLSGPLTGGAELTRLVGDGLIVDGGALAVDQTVPTAHAPTLQDVLWTMDGTGTAANPYVITNDHELQAMAASLSAHYRLGNDVDASLTGEWNGGWGFAPIGSDSDPFAGTFDGDGHTITGLTIDRASESQVSLFGVTDSGTTLTNVHLDSVAISGYGAVGGLVGDNSGTVARSSTTGSVGGVGDGVGGLVGDNSGTVERSYATGSVSGPVNAIGGLVGDNSGTVERSFATGSVTSYADVVGGLVGDNSGTVSDGYWDTEATGQDTSAGSPNSNGLTTSEMQGAEAADSMTGFDFANVWETVDAENDSDVSEDDYPVLQALDRATQLAVQG